VKQTALIVGILALGIGAGYLLFSSGVVDVRSSGRTDATEIQTLRRERFEDLERIKELEAEIERLKALLAQASTPEEPYPGDTPEKVERLLSEAYAETNVDWLIEVIDRLLAMGEPGYPLLRKLIMDIAFKAKFRPAQTDFRIDHLYKVGRIFANREKKFIGFINFLLTESGTHPYLKQGAMMAGAFYVGSNAPGTEDLKQTMMQQFLETQGTSGIAGALPGDIGKKMQIFAMAMTGNKEMIGPLRKELEQTQKKRDQADIIKALAYLGDPATVPLVKERLDPTQDNRQLIEALGRVGTEEAHETATNFLRSVTDSKQFYSQARAAAAATPRSC
jgi:hypothetical protein